MSSFVISSNIIIFLAIILELSSSSRVAPILIFLDSIVSRHPSWKKKPFTKEELHSICDISIQSFSMIALFISSISHGYEALNHLYTVEPSSKQISFSLLPALIAYASIIALHLGKNTLIYPLLSISLLFSNLAFSITINQKDLLFLFLGIEITNLPFIILLLRSNISEINFRNHTIHHFIGFFLALSSILIIVFFQEETHINTKLYFDFFIINNVPPFVVFIATLLILISPLSRTYLIFFGVGKHIISIAPRAVSFVTVPIAAMINILFFMYIHDELYLLNLTNEYSDLIVFALFIIIAVMALIPAGLTLLTSDNLSIIIYSSISYLHAYIVIFFSIASNSIRYSQINQLFILSSVCTSTLFIVMLKLSKNGLPIVKTEDLQDVTHHQPKLVFLLIFCLIVILEILLIHNFNLQPTFSVFSEISSNISIPYFTSIKFVVSFIFTLLIIPQVYVLSQIINNSFRYSLGEKPIQLSQDASSSKLLIILSTALLIFLPIFFGN